MTLFTDNPFEKMMIQSPGGRRDNAPPLSLIHISEPTRPY